MSNSGANFEGLLPAQVVSGSTLQIDVTKSPYNVVPGVTANPEVKIQEAIIQAHENYLNGTGPTVVYCPTGIYSGMVYHTIPQTHASEETKAACVYGLSGVRLVCGRGTIFKLASSVSIPTKNSKGETTGIVNQVHFLSTKFPYSQTQLTEKWEVEDLIIDGNAVNQSSSNLTVTATGFGIYAGKECKRIRCTVRNLWGNSTSTTTSESKFENFHFEDNNCLNTISFMCIAERTEGETATGFSADNSVGSTWIKCISRGMSVNCGFTAWQSYDLSYIGCWSYSNHGAGYNIERCGHVTYTGCASGGLSALISPGNPANPYYPSGQETLGNTGVGWSISGCNNLVLDTGCRSYANAGGNVLVKTDPVNSGIGGYYSLTGTVEESSGKKNRFKFATSQTELIPGMSVITGNPESTTEIPIGTVIEKIISSTEVELSASVTPAVGTEMPLQIDRTRSCWNVRIYGTHRGDNTTNVKFREEIETRKQVGLVPEEIHTALKQIDCIQSGNQYDSVPDATVLGGYAPWIEVLNRNEASGLRVNLQTGITHASNALRVYINGNQNHSALSLNGVGQGSFGGMYRTTRILGSENATILASDQIIAHKELTGEIKDTLPKVSEVETGTEYLVEDQSGVASAANKIVISVAGSETIIGPSVIEVPLAKIKVRSNATTWVAELVTGALFTKYITSSEKIKIPSTGLYRIVAVGGGAGGGGGGSAKSVGGTSTQVGGGGGGAGQLIEQVINISSGVELTCTIGTGGAGGAGGAVNENPGSNGVDGVSTTVVGSGVSVTALGGGHGSGSLANSATTTGGGGYGYAGVGEALTNLVSAIGQGGLATSAIGQPPGISFGLSGRGGGGGAPASATEGGAGGTASISNTKTGTTAGGEGLSATANTGNGGGGGGGGSLAGAGGKGGSGGSGSVVITRVG